MSGFEFLFSFYGLLLGLAVANVATGFADMWRGRKELAVGVLPPLIGLFVLLAAAQQWSSFWVARDELTMGPWPMLTALGMALPYIFVSQAMFARTPEDWPSLEDYCLKHNGVLMGALAIPPIVSAAYNLAVSDTPLAVVALSGGPRLLIPLVLAVWRNRWAQRIGCAVLCAWALVLMF